MKWSHNELATACKLGVVLSVVGVGVAFVLRNAADGVQTAAVLAFIVISFVASMIATRRPEATPRSRHTVSRIPLPSDARQAA